MINSLWYFQGFYVYGHSGAMFGLIMVSIGGNQWLNILWRDKMKQLIRNKKGKVIGFILPVYEIPKLKLIEG